MSYELGDIDRNAFDNIMKFSNIKEISNLSISHLTNELTSEELNSRKEWKLRRAAMSEDRNLILRLEFSLLKRLKMAVSIGNSILIDELLDEYLEYNFTEAKYPIYNILSHIAARYGHIDIVKHFYELDKNNTSTGLIFYQAAIGGHINIMKWADADNISNALLNVSATQIGMTGDLTKINSMLKIRYLPGKVLTGLLRAKHIELSIQFIDELKNDIEDIYNIVLRESAYSGDLDGVKQSLAHGADDVDQALINASEADSVDVYRHLINLGNNVTEKHINNVLINGNFKIFDYIKSVPNVEIYTRVYNIKEPKMLEYMLKNGINKPLSTDIYRVFWNAIRINNISMIKFIDNLPISKKRSINGKNNKITAVSMAITGGYFDLFVKLYNRLDNPKQHKQHFIKIAVDNGFYKIAKSLL
jgi:hypothetical protein